MNNFKELELLKAIRETIFETSAPKSNNCSAVLESSHIHFSSIEQLYRTEMWCVQGYSNLEIVQRESKIETGYQKNRKRMGSQKDSKQIEKGTNENRKRIANG